MTRYVRALVFALAVGTTNLTLPRAAIAAATAGVDEDATAALKRLNATEPAAKLLSQKAKAILVSPGSSRRGSSSARTTARGCSSRTAGRGRTTTRWRDRTGIRRVCRATATCSS